MIGGYVSYPVDEGWTAFGGMIITPMYMHSSVKGRQEVNNNQFSRNISHDDFGVKIGIGVGVKYDAGPVDFIAKGGWSYEAGVPMVGEGNSGIEFEDETRSSASLLFGIKVRF